MASISPFFMRFRKHLEKNGQHFPKPKLVCLETFGMKQSPELMQISPKSSWAKMDSISPPCA